MALTRRQRKLRSEVEEIASKICLDPWNIEQYEADARTTEAIELPIQDICAGAYRYRARDQSLVSMAVNDWKVCMTEDFSEAHRRLDRILRFFLVVCAAGFLVGIVNNDWSFAAVWLVAGFLNGVIGFTVRERGNMPPTSTDNEAADERLLAGSITTFSSLVAGSILVLGFVMPQPWWEVLIATAVGWFVGTFGTMLICTPRKKF